MLDQEQKDKIYNWLDRIKITDEDLIEYVSLLTLSRGGKVFSVSRNEVPDNTAPAAVLRF